MRTSKFLTLSSITALLLLTFFSCKKDEDNPQSNLNFGDDIVIPRGKVNDYVASRKAEDQSFKVSASSTETFTTKAGTKITVPANAFKKLNGDQATGEIEVKVVEIFKKSDMMKSNRPTMSDGKVLISGGEFSFAAYTTAGDSLLLDDGMSLTVEAPMNPNTETGMTLFAGEIDQDDQFNWEQLTIDSVRVINQGNYVFDTDTLGWINIDKFYNTTTTTITINLGTGFTTEKALTYIIFNNINSILSPSNYNGTIGENSYEQSLMPLGDDITIICLAEKLGKLYLAELDATVSADATYDLSFNEMTSEEIDDVLESFDN